LLGHNASSVNTIIKKTPGILQITEFFLTPQHVLTTTVMVIGALLCNTTTLFSVTEKSLLMDKTDLCVNYKGIMIYAEWLVVL
jgi:hypothetical protein